MCFFELQTLRYMQKTCFWLAILLFTAQIVAAQAPPAPEPSPNDFILLQWEAQPINLDSVKATIVYPPTAKEAMITGKVVVRIMIDEQGHYVKCLVIKDPHPLLTKAVTDKIGALRFRPAIANGKPVKVWVTIPFDFRLNQAAAPTDVVSPKPQTAY